MIHLSRWKVILLALSFVFGLLFAWPKMLTAEQRAALPGWVPKGVLNLGLDTSKPTGALMANVLASVAQFEREIMLERQREGIAKAKAGQKYKGRAPTARAK